MLLKYTKLGTDLAFLPLGLSQIKGTVGNVTALCGNSCIDESVYTVTGTSVAIEGNKSTILSLTTL